MTEQLFIQEEIVQKDEVELRLLFASQPKIEPAPASLSRIKQRVLAHLAQTSLASEEHQIA